MFAKFKYDNRVLLSLKLILLSVTKTCICFQARKLIQLFCFDKKLFQERLAVSV